MGHANPWKENWLLGERSVGEADADFVGDLEGSLDRLVTFNRKSAKSHSGIYRDLVVRKRKTEIDEMLRDINGPIFNKVAEIIHDIEEGRRVNERANLDELAEFVAAHPATPATPATPPAAPAGPAA